MKASLRLREEQKPLFKAKVPLNILGIPFQSSLSAGDTKELSLGLATFFDSGPSFRLSYRPNDAFNPFSLLIKTGIGHFGSPVDAPLTMTAEFNFLANSTTSSSPRFFLHFKPRFGDFSIKKSSESSTFIGNNFSSTQNGTFFEDSSLEVIEKPREFDNNNVGTGGGKITSLPLRPSLESAISGMELGAKTALPIRNGAVLNLRWGIKFPEGFQSFLTKTNPTAKASPHGIPLLVLNKIGIEHVSEKDMKVGPTHTHTHTAISVVGLQGSGSSAELAESCFSVKRQLETLRCENAQLGQALDDLRVEFGNKGGFKRGKGERKTMEVDVEGDGDGGVADVTKV